MAYNLGNDNSYLHKLAEGNFQEKDGQSTGNQADKIGNEEGPASVFVAEIRKPPDVAETNGESDARHQEIQFAAPTLPLGNLLQRRSRR